MLRLVQSFNCICTSLNVIHRTASSSTAALWEKLGLPERPKRPPSVFMMFKNRYYDELKKNYPEASITEISKITSKLWKEASQKEKNDLQEEYSKRLKEYLKEKEDYQNSLTEEQKMEIQEALKDIKVLENLKLKKKQKKEKMLEKNKPVAPMKPYIRFVKDLRNQDSSKLSNTEITSKWVALPEEKKDQYKARFQKEYEIYKKELLKWEEKMIREGNVDLVRSTTLKSKTK